MPQAMQAVYRKTTLALSDVAYLRHLKRRLMLIESNLVQYWSRFWTAEKQKKVTLYSTKELLTRTSITLDKSSLSDLINEKPKNQFTLHIHLYWDEALAYKSVARLSLLYTADFLRRVRNLKVNLLTGIWGKLHSCVFKTLGNSVR